MASVSPESPENVSSEFDCRNQNDSVLTSPGTIDVRAPISAPLVRTSSGTFCCASPVSGSTVMVTPRASLL